MTDKRLNQETQVLLKLINNAILEKKGEDLLNLDMTNINNAVAEFFVICHANSETQVAAIAANIEKDVKNNLHEKPWKKEGINNKEWVLLDFANIVIHIFNSKSREFYKLERLWADADIIRVEK